MPDFDITSPKQLKLVIDAAEIVVNCGIYINIKCAENETDLAHQVNGEEVNQLGALTKQTGAWVLYISNDFVFDGRLDRLYIEIDQPSPLNAYGKSRLAGK